MQGNLLPPTTFSPFISPTLFLPKAFAQTRMSFYWKTLKNFLRFFCNIFLSEHFSISLTINKTKTSVAITKVSLLFGLIKMSWKCCSKWLFVKVVLFYKLLFSKLVSYQLVFCLVYLTIHGNNAADCCWCEFFCVSAIFFLIFWTLIYYSDTATKNQSFVRKGC